MLRAVHAQLGERPKKPARPGVNPFLLYCKANWERCRIFTATQEVETPIRSTLGKWWKAATAEEILPFKQQGEAAQEVADVARKEWEQTAQKWDDAARVIRLEFQRRQPGLLRVEGGKQEEVVGVSKRKTNVSNCVVLDQEL